MLFWEIAGKHNMVIFDIKCITVIEKNQISEANNDFIIRYSGNYLSIGGGISGSFHSNLTLKHFGAGTIFSNIGGKFACSTHQQCHFIYNKDYSYNLFCVAGVIFGEVGR